MGDKHPDGFKAIQLSRIESISIRPRMDHGGKEIGSTIEVVYVDSEHVFDYESVTLSSVLIAQIPEWNSIIWT